MPITITAADSGAQASILPELGFNCYRFAAPLAGQTIEVIDSQPGFEAGGKSPRRSGIPLLFPFPNRIFQGRMTWDGKEYQLPKNDDYGNAIHGLVIDRPWRVLEQTGNSVTGIFRLSIDAPDRRHLWPADFEIEVRYELRGTTLDSLITIRNPDQVPLPWGFGTHVYFHFPLAAGSTPKDCLVQVPATRQWLLHDCIPTGELQEVSGRLDLREGLSLEGVQFDDVLTGLVPQAGGAIRCVLMDARAGLQITQTTDTLFRELVIFTPPRGNAVCFEPYTCVTDAVNLQARGIEAGWRVLDPGAELQTAISIRADLVYA